MTFILHFLESYSLSIFFLAVLGCIVATIIPVVAYRMPMLLICLFLAISAIYLKGGNDERVKYELEKKDNETKIANLEKERSDLSTEMAVISAKNKSLIIANGKLKDVNDYITNSEELACNLGPGFIGLHNDAASNTLSKTTK